MMKGCLGIFLGLYLTIGIGICLGHTASNYICRSKSETRAMVYSGMIMFKKAGCWLGEPVE